MIKGWIAVGWGVSESLFGKASLITLEPGCINGETSRHKRLEFVSSSSDIHDRDREDICLCYRREHDMRLNAPFKARQLGPRSFGHFVPTHRRSLQRNYSTRSHLASHSNCLSRRHVTPQREEIGGVADTLFSEALATAYVTTGPLFSAMEKQKLRKRP